MIALVLAVVFAAEPPLPGQWPPLLPGMMAAPTAGEPAPSSVPTQKPIVVDVVAYAPSGRTFPAVGAEVRIEVSAQSMGDDGTTLERVWLASADDKGRATFTEVPEPGPGRTLRAVARWAGHDWEGELDGRIGHIVVSSTSDDVSIVRGNLGFTLMPREEELFVDSALRLTVGDETVTYDGRRGRALPLPMLTYAPFGAPLDGAWLPPRPNPDVTQFTVEPEWAGHLVVENGTMVYRGIVPPDGVTLIGRYSVRYVEETHHVLATRTPVALDGFQVSVVLGQGLAPEVSLRTPFQSVVRPQGDGERRLLVPLSLPAKDAAIFIDVDDTPSRLALIRPAAAILALGVVLALVLVFFRTIGRAVVRSQRP